MKIVFITDTHFRGISPKNRKDDFVYTLKKKIQEVVDYCNDNQVDLLLHGGDFFDRPDVSPAIFKDFAKILLSCKCPIYGVHGNHDIYGHNPSTLPRTMLGILDGLNIVNLLGDEVEIIENNSVKLQLSGCGYSYDIEKKENYIIKNQSAADFSIHLVHGMLLPKKSIPTEKLTIIDEIKETEADITLCGHYHSGFGVIEIAEKFFINPGALVRIDNSMSEIKREPKILEITLCKGCKPEIKFIPLKSAQRGDAVLDRTELELKSNQEGKLLDFLDGILDITSNKYLVVEEIINTIADSNGVNDIVKKRTLELVSLVQSEFSEQEDIS